MKLYRGADLTIQPVILLYCRDLVVVLVTDIEDRPASRIKMTNIPLFQVLSCCRLALGHHLKQVGFFLNDK